jgi:hypothetical protein
MHVVCVETMNQGQHQMLQRDCSRAALGLRFYSEDPAHRSAQQCADVAHRFDLPGGQVRLSDLLAARHSPFHSVPFRVV